MNTCNKTTTNDDDDDSPAPPPRGYHPLDINKNDGGAATFVKDRVISVFVLMCSVIAWMSAMFVPIWKIIDTSYLFRSRDDPSLYSQFKDYFGPDSKWPYAKMLDSGKDTYRIYFFIMPFVVAFMFFFLKGRAMMFTPKERRVCVDRPQFLKLLRYRTCLLGLSVIDLLMITMALTYSGLLVAARMHRSLDSGAKKLTFLSEPSSEPIEAVSWQGCEIMAKTLGVLSIVLLGWFVLMPMGRKSILLEVLGVPREIALKYHRWLGWYTLVVTMTHMILYFSVWIYGNGHPVYDPQGTMVRHMMVPRSCKDGSCDAETYQLHMVTMYGYATILTVVVMCITSLNYIRRKYYEVFYYSHQLYRLVILFLCFHYKSAMVYLLPGICMILIDKTIGYVSIFFSIKAQGKIISSDVFELKVKKDKTCRCEAGQYIFVNALTVSLLEWHPMTVTWETEDELAVHIKTRGEGSWTNKVFEEIRSSAADSASGGWGSSAYLPVRLDGFYGSNQIESGSLGKKDAVLFFAGGVGLTFPMSIIEDLCQSNPDLPVHLFWITRTMEEFDAFANLLLQKKRAFSNLSVSAWITLSNTTSPEETSTTASTDIESASWSHFEQASVVPIKSNKSTPSTQSDGARNDDAWTGFPTWLWSSSMHALVNALAIILGTTGYALAKKNSASVDELPQQPRYMLVNRFLELFFCVFMVSAFVYSLIGFRLARQWWATRKMKTPRSSNRNKSLPQLQKDFEDTRDLSWSSSSSSSRGINGGDASEITAELIVDTGQRPDISWIFELMESQLLLHSSSGTAGAAVNACGPQAMVKLVQDECQKRVWANWTMYEEEWDW